MPAVMVGYRVKHSRLREEADVQRVSDHVKRWNQMKAGKANDVHFRVRWCALHAYGYFDDHAVT